jgi:hypothetical protein
MWTEDIVANFKDRLNSSIIIIKSFPINFMEFHFLLLQTKIKRTCLNNFIYFLIFIYELYD